MIGVLWGLLVVFVILIGVFWGLNQHAGREDLKDAAIAVSVLGCADFVAAVSITIHVYRHRSNCC